MIEQALERWLHALHAHGEPAFVEAAFSADAVLERFGWDGDPRPKEVFDGREAITGWLKRSPPGTRFTAGDIQATDEGHEVAYAITLKEFRNHGHWHVILNDDGRIRSLSHHPKPLPKPEFDAP